MTSLRSRQHGSESNKSSAIQACFMVVRGVDNDDANDNNDDADDNNDNNDDAYDNIDDDDGTQLGTQSSRKLLGNNHLLRNSAGLTEKGSRIVLIFREAGGQQSTTVSTFASGPSCPGFYSKRS